MTYNVLIGLILLVITWHALRYGAYLVSSWRAGSLRGIRKQLGGLAKPILRGTVTAGLAEMIVLPTYPLGVFCGREPMGEGTPVLLVHGLFHNSSAWLVMKGRLKQAGFSNLHTYQYNSFTGEFDTAVDGLQRKLDRLLQAHPGRKVLLVAHSLGGAVCRRAVGNPRYWDRVAGLVALGTPHGGSDLARFGGNRMARGLIPGREIPKKVAAVPDPHCPRLAIYNLVDDFVFPLWTLQPGRPGWEERLCSPMGHVWMLYSREVTEMVVEFLRKADQSSDRSNKKGPLSRP